MLFYLKIHNFHRHINSQSLLLKTVNTLVTIQLSPQIDSLFQFNFKTHDKATKMKYSLKTLFLLFIPKFTFKRRIWYYQNVYVYFCMRVFKQFLTTTFTRNNECNVSISVHIVSILFTPNSTEFSVLFKNLKRFLIKLLQTIFCRLCL